MTKKSMQERMDILPLTCNHRLDKSRAGCTSGKVLAMGVVVAALGLCSTQVLATVITNTGLTDKNKSLNEVFQTADSNLGYASRIDTSSPIAYTRYPNHPATTGGESQRSVTFEEGNGWTPNIVLDWSQGFESYTSWPTGEGDVIQTDFNSGGTDLLLTFTPDSGYGVRLNSFDMIEADSTKDGNTVVDWSVMSDGGTTTLASGRWDQFDDVNQPSGDGGRSIITPTGYGFVNGPVQLKLTHVSGDVSYIAMDTINFSQVPEPASVALLGIGIGATMLMYWRRQQPGRSARHGR